MSASSVLEQGNLAGRLLGRFGTRTYEAFGWRSILVFVGGAWSIGLPMVVLGPLVFHNFAHLTVPVTLTLMKRFAITWFLCVCAVLTATAALCRPLWHAERHHDQPSIEAAWGAVVQLPARFGLWAVPTALIPGIVGGLWSVSTVVHLDLQLLVIGTFATAAGTGGMIFAAVTALPLVTRPILRSLAPHTGSTAISPPPVSLRAMVRIVVPLIGVMTAVAGAAFSLSPGDDQGPAIFHLAIAAGVATLVSVPASLMLGHAILQSMEDLLSAAQRIKDGDYTTPIRTQSTNEFNRLRQSFNEAMDGLSERAALAEANSGLLDDVRDSRRRIIETADATQRRIERNLHDGAQQPLIAATVRLKLLHEQLAEPEARAMATEIEEMIGAALEDLRMLSRGLNPQVLATDGLRPALRQLASSCAVPTQVNAANGRYADAVEATLYYVASEGLANAARHAHATLIQLDLVERPGVLEMSITDNGVGGASVAGGTGLMGLLDRVAAIDGTLDIDSPPGCGTSIRASIPLA